MWLTLFCVAVLTLGGIHRYGTGWVAYRHAAQLLDQADAQFARGDVEESQRLLLQAMQEEPAIGAAVSERLGPRMLAMPSLMERLAVPGAPSTTAVEAEARHALLRGEIGLAAGILADMEEASPAAVYWQGQLALREGDFSGAARHFEAYWGQRSDRPRPAGAATPAESALALFDRGRWPEAFALVAALAQQGELEPELAFIQAVADELQGRREQAVKMYRAVVDARPSHFLALTRLARENAAS